MTRSQHQIQNNISTFVYILSGVFVIPRNNLLELLLDSQSDVTVYSTYVYKYMVKRNLFTHLHP